MSIAAMTFRAASAISFAALTFPTQDVMAQTPLALKKTLAQFKQLCEKADYNKMSQNLDFFGLDTWRNYCAISYDATKNPQYLHRLAIASMYMARYHIEYRRRPDEAKPIFNPVAGTTTDGDSEDKNNPIKYWVFGQAMLNRAAAAGLDVSATQRLMTATYNNMWAALENPQQQYKHDDSSAASCVFNDIKHTPQEEMDAINACADAYNKRPLGIFAYEYAAAVYLAAKGAFIKQDKYRPIASSWFFNKEIDAYENVLRNAYIARNFYQRATADGVPIKDMIELNDNLIDRSKETLSDLKIGRIQQMAAVGAIFAVSAAGVRAIITTPGTGAGIAVQPALNSQQAWAEWMINKSAQEAVQKALLESAAKVLPLVP